MILTLDGLGDEVNTLFSQIAKALLATLALSLWHCSTGADLLGNKPSGSHGSSATNTLPTAEPSSDSIADSETSKSTPPQQVTGAFLTDCGLADGHGYGCLVHEAGSPLKANVQISEITATYSDGSSEHPGVTAAPAQDPWSVYFRIPAAKVTSLAKLGVQIQGAEALGSVQARSILYMPTATAPAAAKIAVDSANVVIFTTRNSFVPGLDFTSSAQADALCARVASAPASVLPARHWIAALATAAVGVEKKAGLITGKIYNSSNAMVASDASAFFYAGNRLASAINGVANTSTVNTDMTKTIFQGPIAYDETGKPLLSDAQMWTGADAGGSALDTCNNWASSTGVGETGTVAVTQAYITGTSRSCNQGAHLYCITAPASGSSTTTTTATDTSASANATISGR